MQHFKSGGGSTWQLYPDSTPKEAKMPIDWASFATPITPDPTTYGYKWNEKFITQVNDPAGARVALPEYYRLAKASADIKKPKWVVASPADVPASSGLASAQFNRPKEKAREPYDSPSDPQSTFHKPGPVAGPFQAHLGDGSIVTYSWYRFADQPAMQNADLTNEARESMQLIVEKMHRAWTKDRQYLAPPTIGTLADLDPAQLVTPPKGFEIGYVPIATRQELAATAGEKSAK